MTAAFAGAAGIVALTRVNRREEFPLAAIPLAFATQQALEGLLWLTLPTQPHGPAQSLLTTVFLLFAKVMWPVLTPFAAWSIEPDRTRRRLIGLCLAGGIAIAAFFLWSLLANVHTARIDGRHIVWSSSAVSAISGSGTGEVSSRWARSSPTFSIGRHSPPCGASSRRREASSSSSISADWLASKSRPCPAGERRRHRGASPAGRTAAASGRPRGDAHQGGRALDECMAYGPADAADVAWPSPDGLRRCGVT